MFILIWFHSLVCCLNFRWFFISLLSCLLLLTVHHVNELHSGSNSIKNARLVIKSNLDKKYGKLSVFTSRNSLLNCYPVWTAENFLKVFGVSWGQLPWPPFSFSDDGIVNWNGQNKNKKFVNNWYLSLPVRLGSPRCPSQWFNSKKTVCTCI